jgi:hypothetical protein
MSNPFLPRSEEPAPQAWSGYAQPQDAYAPYPQPYYQQAPLDDGQPGYGLYGSGQPGLGAHAPTNSKAVISLILGIVSWLGAIILTGIPAVIVGHMALREINASSGTRGGKPLALVGLVLGYLSIAFFLVLAAGWLFFVVAARR